MGGETARDEEEESQPGRSLIRCRPTAGQAYGLTVSGAVGAIAVGDLQVIVRPKIPMDHFIYLLDRSGQLPRLDATKAALATDDSFWDLVARWYLDQLQQVVGRSLRDYRGGDGTACGSEGSDAPASDGARLLSGSTSSNVPIRGL